jgi:hypothetical protein
VLIGGEGERAIVCCAILNDRGDDDGATLVGGCIPMDSATKKSDGPNPVGNE